jgi:hypothetical protein
MAVPNKKEIAIKKEKLAGFLKLLDSTGRMPEKRLVAMIRGAIRQAWMKAPNKLAKLEQERIPDMDPLTRTKWLFECAICKGKFKASDVEVDHIKGHHTFRKLEEFHRYCDTILNAPLKGLQVLCKKHCHPVKTLAEARGITFEEAKFEKRVIAFTKCKAKDQISILARHKLSGSNATKREKAYRDLLKGGANG